MPFTTVGQHLLARLKENNIHTIFGVPGDFNMPLLDLIEDDTNLHWGNNTNELNAAYAADGYARIRGAGAVVTTFGVGELSAINGIAGSYSELLPVIHIVGTPSTASQNSGALLHHTLGDGNFDSFQKMSTIVTVASTSLSLSNAVQEIDRVILTAISHKRPGYISIPIDLINAKIECPSISPLQIMLTKNPEALRNAALKLVLKQISVSNNPAIIVDGCISRYHLESKVKELVKVSGFSTFSAPMGKGIIDESLPNYRGVYAGSVTLDRVTEEIENADLLIEIGSIKSDVNTGIFSYNLENIKTISLNVHSAVISHTEYPGVGMCEILPLIIGSLPINKKKTKFKSRAKSVPTDNNTTEITHNYLWNKLPDFIIPNSIIVLETGTAAFGAFNMKSPKGATFISQLFWCSIGYSIGAAVGAAIADRSRKVYLFVGDGSFQLAAQEISVFIRQGLTPVIFLLNNNGYLMEKLINGPERSYNNFQMWKYSKTLDYFGGDLEVNKTKGKNPSPIGIEAKVSTRQEFEYAMEIVNKEPNKIHFLEVVMPEFDSPRELSLMVAALNRIV